MRVKDKLLGGLARPCLGTTKIQLQQPGGFSSSSKHLGENAIGFKPHDLRAGDTSIEEEEDIQDTDDVLTSWKGHDPLPYPEFMRGRLITNHELEDSIQPFPFSCFSLMRGQKHGRNVFGVPFKSTYQFAGIFKALIRTRVVDEDGEEGNVNEEDNARFERFLENVMLPRPVSVRLYVLKGFNIVPMDYGSGGGKSDPYLKLSLGSQKVSDRKHYIDNTVEPEFYKSFELTTTLPGEGRLHIKCMDYDFISSDDVIGETVIDLEDRW